MTPSELKAIRKRAEAASPGPWKTWGMEVRWDRGGRGDYDESELICASYYTDADGKCRTFDADFIAHARQDIPALLKYIEEMEGKLAAR